MNDADITMQQGNLDSAVQWPALPLLQWKDTCATLHMWTQVVGKIRLALTPLINYWGYVPLYVMHAASPPL